MFNLFALQGLLAQNNGDAAAAGVMGLGCCCYIGIILFALAMIVFWIWMIVEVATKEPSEDPNKMMWILIVILCNWIGALIYYFARRPERKRKYGR